MEDKVVEVTQIEGRDVERNSVNSGVDATMKDGAQDKLQNQLQEKHQKQLGPQMTKKFLKDHCKQNKLYSTPWLNDALYLHFKGFTTIENLEDYTGLKCLWLESNGLQRIENLDAQTGLRCLFLQQNLIYKLENLEHLKRLCTLNVSNNYIHIIENISCLPELSTLQIAHNKLETVGDIEHLSHCLAISVLDMAHNLLNDPEIIPVLEAMPELRVLNLMGNEVVKKIPNYRKTMIVRLKQLTFLDDRPVFPKDRACAEAWAVGGLEGERKERELWETRERRKIQDSLDGIALIRKTAQEQQRLRERQEKGETEVSTTSFEENTQILNFQEEKIQAFVQESLHAHEEFLQCQTTYEPSEQQPNREHIDSEQPGQRAQKERLERDDPDQIKQPVREDKGGNPNQSASEGEKTGAEKLGRVQGTKQDNTQIQPEQLCILEMKSEQCGKKNPTLARTCPPKADEVAPAHCPGPLVTELDDTEHIETIDLSLHQSLCIDDLPDLEDVDTEDFTAVIASKQMFKPTIEVISESSKSGNQIDTIFTFSSDNSSLLSEASNNSSLLVYEDASDVLEPLILEPVGITKRNQTSSPQQSPPRCLIEELE
ncbi:Dynein assembly factor 1, axonemal Leucine-rich repeat-containing protein 50 [Channa argus]|uniref:Dynein assembly factor 1, axonemal Leucine-rich repeat-containing protein 50 n=1 Tax=Channa argus TaxID=215402 RepID=A0A6G1Q2X5_CHAAH|nr:Dynein assembly factor 1, axonemal Leucine-rich repeat-containing protein 50 [Channa argus]KAK2897553.1 hypothetical protein Q8A73_013933 [Channa argus]